ncbi:MarR family winged helix-turn-helix transcriptional regulator [Sphingomonas sp. LY160]|uniref:MarR family winged helix-turn-helix transcriptional regulator n=1 Tax=Sphingomonas sp. LY160 TaxID=3095342 RepID=UPI002ADEDBE5|nr:MarR family winged helix-turn-helix transcriptional regulator [Sphingomonas sp. LY160]MEA1071631.1 MarR family winged helix-turn-helix transcriptional regulator [Sphingomonas sp. LY160]
MDNSAYPQSFAFADYAGPPPVLIAASTAAAHDRAAQEIEAAGLRIAPISIAEAPARLSLQAAASALWVELDEDDGDALLDRIEADAGERFPAIVAAPMSMIDRVFARLGGGATEVLIDPTPSDRVAALSLALASRSDGAVLHDVAAEPSAQRLRQLSDEVSRIAATLARLSTGPAVATLDRPEPAAQPGEAPAVASETIRQIIRARRLRARFFAEDLFADPAWDMLLDLLAAEIAQHRVPVSSLCIAASVPPTTALRWIKTMTDNGLFKRRADPHDGRRVFVELAPDASNALRRYFGEVGKMTGI